MAKRSPTAKEGKAGNGPRLPPLPETGRGSIGDADDAADVLRKFETGQAAGHPAGPGADPAPGHPGHLSGNEYLESFEATHRGSSAEPPIETINFLCRLLLNEMGRANPLVVETLEGINNRFPDASFHDTVHRLLELNEKSKPDDVLDDLLEKILKGGEDDRWAERLDALFAEVPKHEEYQEQVRELAELSHDFRQRLAARLTPVLNARVRGMPHGDLEEKKAVCEFVNNELERFGLALKCPNTPGLPAKLKASTGNWPGVGRFRFETYIDGQRKMPAFSDTLPVLEVIDANPAKDLESTWQEKVGPKASRAGRKLAD